MAEEEKQDNEETSEESAEEQAPEADERVAAPQSAVGRPGAGHLRRLETRVRPALLRVEERVEADLQSAPAHGAAALLLVCESGLPNTRTAPANEPCWIS